MNPAQKEMADRTNPERMRGHLADAMRGADVFVGVSAPGVVSEEMIRSMAMDPIVFPMANPVPEIAPSNQGTVLRLTADPALGGLRPSPRGKLF